MRRKNHIEFSQPENGGTIIPALLIVCWMFGELSMGNCRMPSTATDQSQLGLLSSHSRLVPGRGQPHTNPCWDCFEWYLAYAGMYNQRPIAALRAPVTCDTFPP